jgi:hypothetical protein
MAKKRIRDLERSNRKAKRQIERTLKRQDKAAEKREVQAQKREEANISRQEMLSDTTPSKQYTRKKKRYDKKVERKVERGQYLSDGTRMTQDDFMTYDQKIQSKENERQKKQQKKAVRKGLVKGLGSAISDRASKEGTDFIENLTTIIGGEQTGNPSPEQVGNKVVSEGVNKAKNTQELTDARNQKGQSEDAIKQAEEEIDKNAQEQYDEVTEEIENRKAIKDVAKDGAGYTLSAKSSLSDLTDDELKKLQGEIWRNAAKNKSGLGNQLLQKLGHEDYYPPQQEFLQSTFTGARIGSQQIISAVPARIPLGLYDARRVAMQKKAKDKEEQLKKLASLNFETAEQFQARLNDEGLDIVFGYVDLFDGDIEAMYKGDTKASQMFLKDLQKLEDIAKEITEVDTYVDGILADVNKSTHYTPKKIVGKIAKWQQGRQDIKSLVKDYDKSNSFLKDGRGIQNWANFQKEAQTVVNNLQENGLWRQYVGKGQDLLELTDEKFQAKYKRSKIEWARSAQEAVYRAEKNSLDYESYRQTVVEYYPVEKARELVEQMYKGNNFYEGSTEEEREEIIYLTVLNTL